MGNTAHPTNVRVTQTHNNMTPEDIMRLSDLLEDFINQAPYEMGSDEDRALMNALEIINEHL